MSRVVDYKKSVTLFFVLLLFITSLSISLAHDVEIFNVYSFGDKAAFVVVNTTTLESYALIYNGSFVEMYPLNFSLRHTLVHWNGKYWLLQKGERGTVELYIYNGTLKHIKTFKNGSLCVDNDLEIKWNGKEYFLTFIEASPHDNPNTGECILKFKHYILKDENLIPVNVSGTPHWVPPLNVWLVGNSLVSENGKVTHLNIVNASLYTEGIAYNDTHVWLVVALNSNPSTYVTIYELNDLTPIKVYSTKVNGNVYPPETLRGNPILIQRIATPKSSNISVLSFNGSALLKIHSLDECSAIYPVSVGGRIFVLCLLKSKAKSAPNILELFEIKNKKTKFLNTFSTQGHVYVYNVDDFRGFNAFKLWKHSSLIIYTNESIFLFNSTHALNLLTGESIDLPDGLKTMGYYASYRRDEWILFNKNEAYSLKNGKFENLTSEIVTSLKTIISRNSIGSPINSREHEGYNISTNNVFAMIAIGLMAIIVVVLLKARNKV